MQISACDVLSLVKQFTADSVIFPALQACLFLVFSYAVAKNYTFFRKKGGATLTVKRGKESWSNFHLAYALLVLVFVEVTSTTEALKGYKTLVTLIDVSALTYLSFFNSWFRNKILSIIVSSQEMEER